MTLSSNWTGGWNTSNLLAMYSLANATAGGASKMVAVLCGPVSGAPRCPSSNERFQILSNAAQKPDFAQHYCVRGVRHAFVLGVSTSHPYWIGKLFTSSKTCPHADWAVDMQSSDAA